MNRTASGQSSIQDPAKAPFTEDPRFLGAIIIILTCIAFFPSLKNNFISTWDDNVYVTENPIIRHLDLQSVKQIFTRQVNGTYVPLPLLSYAIEYRFFGSNPLPFHITNLVFHLLSVLLVFQLFRLLKINILFAAAGALLFGIHPMRVESVAWIAERKDIFYSFFYLAALVTHVKFNLTGAQGKKYYWLTLLFFILSLLSKIMAVTLPLSLLLIDYFMERPLKIRLIIEKIPHFLLSLFFGCLGIIILHRTGGLAINRDLSFIDRLFYGFLSMNVYIAKFFVPYARSALYPYPVTPGNSLPLYCYLSPLLTAGFAFLVYKTARFTRAVVFGALFFFVNVIFMLQIVSAGLGFMSDRYTYIAYIGLIFIVIWGLEQLIKKKRERKLLIWIVMACYFVVFIFMTNKHCSIWNNGKVLWTDVVEKYPDNIIAAWLDRATEYGNLGQWDKSVSDCSKAIGINPGYKQAYLDRGFAYGNLGQPDKAITDYIKAISLDPDYKEAYYNRGNEYVHLGQWDKAIDDYSKATGIAPDYKEAYFNRGIAYGNMGDPFKAIDDYTKAIGIAPDYKEAYLNRGIAWGNLKQPDKAIDDFTKAIGIDPDYKEAFYNRGIEFGNMKQWDDAISDYSRAIGIDPNYKEGYANRGAAYGYLGQTDKAINDFTKAIGIDPNYKEAYLDRGCIYGSMRQLEMAIDDFTRAIGISPDYKEAYYNRGNEFAYRGQWEKAITDYSKAIVIDPGYENACFNRGIAYGNIGQWDKAINDYNRVLEIDPDFTVAYNNREIAYRNSKGSRK